MTTFEDQARLLKPRPRHAQIFLELVGEAGTLDKALGVLRLAGAEPFRCTSMGDGPGVIIELSSPDMREAVRRLSEAGFVKVMGINASRDRSGTKQGKKAKG